MIWKVLFYVWATVRCFAWRLFLKRIAKAVLIYLVISYSYSLAVIVYLYLVIRNRAGGDLTQWQIPEIERSRYSVKAWENATGWSHGSRTALEVIVPTVIHFFPLVVYSLPLPITVLLIAVWTCLSSLNSLLDAREEEFLREAKGHSYRILRGFWPSAKHYFEEMVKSRMGSLNPTFQVKSIDLGCAGPEVKRVEVRMQYVGYEKRIFLDVSVMYDVGSLCCTIWKPGLELQVRNIKIQAVLNIELMNFDGFPPFVRKVVVHMEKDPIIDPSFISTAHYDITPIKKYVLHFIRREVKSCFPITPPPWLQTEILTTIFKRFVGKIDNNNFLLSVVRTEQNMEFRPKAMRWEL
ncbi:uncharacterized protein [Macrobrachium rosenbergii]|uniref:uncharacterized protein isoform X2 n=1 Tax=Macrobrachium rosenbergii TaxID=79674 RepID=UPI0034D68903